MKKLFSVLLMMSVLLAMVFCMSACGGEEETPSAPAGSNPFPEALTNVEAMAVSNLNLDYTGWTLSGGMIDGVEMEEADVQSVLDACGGQMLFVFQESGAVQLVNGAAAMDGTYTVTGDGFIVDMTFENYSYWGAFTMVQEQPVLIVVGKKAPGQALYMAYVDEK